MIFGKWNWPGRLVIRIIKYYQVVKLKELWGHGHRGTFNFKAAVSLLIKMLEVALEGLVVVVNRVTCSVLVLDSTLYMHACHPRGALPAPGLAGWPVGRGE